MTKAAITYLFSILITRNKHANSIIELLSLDRPAVSKSKTQYTIASAFNYTGFEYWVGVQNSVMSTANISCLEIALVITLLVDCFAVVVLMI
jgi:hypothetical protein